MNQKKRTKSVWRRATDSQSLTVQECRQILGTKVEGHSDEQIARVRDDLEHVAAVMYDEMAKDAKSDFESVRWSA